MSFKVVYRPGEEHKCKLPDTSMYSTGTIIQCDECNQKHVLSFGDDAPIFMGYRWKKIPVKQPVGDLGNR